MMFVNRISSSTSCSICLPEHPDTEFISEAITIFHDVVPFAIGEAVSVLYRDNGNNSARALDVLPRNVRQSDKANLSLVLQLSQSFNGGVKGYKRIRVCS